MKGFSYHDHDPHEVDHEALNQEPDLFLADMERLGKHLRYDDSLRKELCILLGLTYPEATDEDVLAKVKELQEIRNGLEYNPSKFRWEQKS